MRGVHDPASMCAEPGVALHESALHYPATVRHSTSDPKIPSPTCRSGGGPFVVAVTVGTVPPAKQRENPMTQYLLGVHHDYESTPPPQEELDTMFKQVDELNAELQSSGVWVFAGGLTPSSAATVVRQVGDEVVTTDGPYAETKEVLGGFWVLELPDLDAALAWARKATVACMAPIEVRPFQD